MKTFILAFLNEVLSLNAQELRHVTYSVPTASLLNEVLSLNAQEFRCIGGQVSQ